MNLNIMDDLGQFVTLVFWRFVDAMLNTVGFRQTEMALQLGTLFKTEEALSIGLIDKIAPQEEVLTAAHQEMQRWLKIPGRCQFK